jgi:hypothetical protein
LALVFHGVLVWVGFEGRVVVRRWVWPGSARRHALGLPTIGNVREKLEKQR